MMEPTSGPVSLPRLFAVRVLTPGGPYEPGDTLALAFTVLGIARVLAHEPRRSAATAQPYAVTIPEALSATVVHPAEPYSVGDVVMLSFVDPSVARVHIAHEAGLRETAHLPLPKAEAQPPKLELAATSPFLAMRWTSDRIRRFVQMSDKLFTVDRLGWYRHSLALRLLLPDEVGGMDASSSATLNEHLQHLRSEATASLGVPLLGAFMPNFVVTPDWLDSLGDSATGNAYQEFRDAAAAHLNDRVEVGEVAEDVTQSPLREARLVDRRPQSIEAQLALLIPTRSPNSALTEALSAYRNDLVDLFEQMSAAADAVRLKTMSQPNHLLDERLWQLTGTLGEIFGPLAVA